MSASEYKEKANALLKNKEYTKALEMYDMAIKLAPEDKVHWSNRSACYMNLEQGDKALEDAEKCIQIDPTWARGYQRKGQALIKLQKTQEAIDTFKQGLTHDPNNETLKTCLSDAEKENNNPFMKNFSKLYTDPRTSKYMTDPQFVNLLQYAIKDQNMLIQMMQSDPRFMDVFSVLSGLDLSKMQENVQKDQKKNEEEEHKRKLREEELKKKQEEELKKKQEQDKINSMSSEEKADYDKKKEAEDVKLQGNAEFKKGNIKEALDFYLKAQTIYPKEVTYHLNLAACYHELKDYNKVIEEAQKLLDNSFDFQKKSKALGRMGFAYQELNNIEKAIECFNASLLEFKDQRIKEALRNSENIKKKKDAEAYIDPEKAEEANTEANAFYKNHDFVKSLKSYTEAIKRNPSVAKYYSNRAACYIKLMSLQEALNDTEKALELDYNFLRAHQRNCNVQFLMKRYHKALTAYEKALKLFPDDAELKEGYYKCVSKINEGGDDEERLKQTMADPEIQALMMDPRVQQLFKDLKENPISAQQAIQKDQFLGEAFRKLVAAGIIKTK